MAVVKEASIIALKRNLPTKSSQRRSDDEPEKNDQFVLLIDDFREAFQHVRPSGLREVAIDVPKVNIRSNEQNSVFQYILESKFISTQNILTCNLTWLSQSHDTRYSLFHAVVYLFFIDI